MASGKRKRKGYEYDTQEIRAIDEELGSRIEERRKAQASLRRSRKRRTVIAGLLAFVLLATICGKDIVRLQSENRALKKQQVALEKQRDELKEELKSVHDQEYIREQARKQLRLLNPGEILFTFDDEEDGQDAGSGDAGEEEAGAEEAGGGDE